MNPEKRDMLPKVAFAGFSSRYREPTVKEGFQDIVKVNFEVSLFARYPLHAAAKDADVQQTQNKF